MLSTSLRKIPAVLVLGWIALSLAACTGFIKGGDNRHLVPLTSAQHSGLRAIGSSPGEAMVIRIFKQESVLEVWKRNTETGQFRMLKSYEICTFSGDLGPKFREGDRQSPEGFYTITPALMHPTSNYHLAFNTGFPNKFDRVHGRTGSNLMVHGDCSSSGCYAMTDEGISEIYALARETFAGGNPSFQLQIYPFRMTPENIAPQMESEHMAFWKDIKEGYDLFELTRTPPVWDVCERQYIFNAGVTGLDAAGPCPAQTRPPELVAKMAADDAAVARILALEARAAADAEAVAARGQAISGFFGRLFGGAPAAPAP